MREQILRMLEKNSRIDLKDLAIMMGVDEVTVANEVAQMEKENIICGYHTLINWDKTSDEKVSAIIEVRVTPQRGQGFDRFAERGKRDHANEVGGAGHDQKVQGEATEGKAFHGGSFRSMMESGFIARIRAWGIPPWPRL